MKRAGIFLFFDPQGRVDDYVIECLTTLRTYLDEILVVSNSPLDEEARSRLLKGATDVLVRENTGFDVGGYKDGLRHFGWERMRDFDELILFNYTFFAPVNPWSHLFDRVQSWGDIDFWGITEHDEVRPHPFLAASRMPRHIQSHWIAVRNPMLTSEDFRRYWDEMPPIRSYNDSIQWHETRFTEHFSHLGYQHRVAYPREDYPSRNPVFDNAVQLLRDGCPILKRRNLFHDPLYLDRHAIIGSDMLAAASAGGYDTDLILTNLARTSRPRDLVTNAGLTSVIAPTASHEAHEAAAGLKVLAVAHIFYADMADEILDRLSVLPAGYHLVATTSTQENKALIEERIAAHNVDGEVRVVSSNRGRDIGAFLIDCRDVLTSDDYDIVVKIHSKKSVQDDYNAAQLFKEHLYDNLLGSSDHVANILADFAAHPGLGMVIAPMPHMGYPTMGHAWFANKTPAREMAKKLGITVPFDDHQPLAPYGSMFIARPQSLRLLTQFPWKAENFPEEGGYKDGSAAHVLERLLAYAVLSRGYYVRPVMTPTWAGVYYGYLEYKLAATSAMLPAYSIDQVPYLKARIGGVPNLLGAVKTNIMVRTPALGNALKPAYRMARGFAHKMRGRKGE